MAKKEALRELQSRLAERLQAAQARYRTVVEGNINGLLVAGPDGRIDLVNPALARMFGYTVDELRGRNIDELLPPARRLALGTRPDAAGGHQKLTRSAPGSPETDRKSVV